MFTKAIAFILLFVGLSFANLSWAEELRILSHPFPPWQFTNEQTKEVDGINVDIAKHIFKKMGLSVSFSEQPWARAWDTIKKGKAEAVMSVSRKKAREPYLHYPTENMWISEYVFFVKKSKKMAMPGTYEDIKQNSLTIGVVNGFSYHKSFWAAFPYQDGTQKYSSEKRDYFPTLVGKPKPETCFKLLAKERMDVCISDKSIGSYLVKSLGLGDQLTHYDAVLFSKGYPMPFVKNSSFSDLKNISEQYEKELVQMKKDGTYQKIVDRWLK